MTRGHTLPALDISASVMCGQLGALAHDVRALEDGGVDSLHVDVMDGHFVPNMTFGPDVTASIVAATTKPVHVHMMVEEPARYVESFADAGADVFIFHIEAERYPARLANSISDRGMVPGIAINPSTPLSFLRDTPAETVLIMTVEPGFAGQRWMPGSIERIAEARELLGNDVVLGVDGNVTPEHAGAAASAGATLFVCGTSSLFFGQSDYTAALDNVRERVVAGSADRDRSVSPR